MAQIKVSLRKKDMHYVFITIWLLETALVIYGLVKFISEIFSNNDGPDNIIHFKTKTMKKIIFAGGSFLLMTIGAFSCCNPNQQSTQFGADSVATDSTMTDSVTVDSTIQE